MWLLARATGCGVGITGELTNCSHVITSAQCTQTLAVKRKKGTWATCHVMGSFICLQIYRQKKGSKG